MTTDTQETEKIAALNDMLRQSQLTGQVELSAGVQTLNADMRQRILSGVKTYNAFAPQGDTQKERDFGAFECGDYDIFWVIDCYDENSHYLSDNPADLNRTNRVLRVMLVEEH